MTRDPDTDNELRNLWDEMNARRGVRRCKMPDLVYKIPQHILYNIMTYTLYGQFPGTALHGFLTNNLKEAIEHSDDETWEASKPIFQFIWNYLPADCWGSKEKFEKWLSEKRLTQTTR